MRFVFFKNWDRYDYCPEGGAGSDDRVSAGCILGMFFWDREPTNLPVCDHAGERQTFGGRVCTQSFFSPVWFHKTTLENKKTIEEWKANRGQMALLLPKFQPEADLSDQVAPRAPVLKLCKMASNGHLEIPRDVRDKWLADPVRSY